MRIVLAVFMLFCSAALLLQGAAAQDTKEVTLKGNITCAKCELKLEKACATVIVVKAKTSAGDKDVVYYFDKEGHKKNHATICTEPKMGSVTGVVSEKDKKKSIEVKTIKFD